MKVVFSKIILVENQPPILTDSQVIIHGFYRIVITSTLHYARKLFVRPNLGEYSQTVDLSSNSRSSRSRGGLSRQLQCLVGEK